MDVRRFSDADRSRLAVVVDHAEELVGDRFAVPSFRESQHAYDVRTLEQLSPDEVPAAPGLASIVRYGRAEASRGMTRFHRICLHDDRILACSEREGLALEAVLLVVLTHELIHLVRFTLRETTFHVPVDQRLDEESEVDRLTTSLLCRYPDDDVRRAVAAVTGRGGPASA